MGDSKNILIECPEGKEKGDEDYCTICPYREMTDYLSSDGTWYYCRQHCKADGKPITLLELRMQTGA